jgi:nucleotide-binding universal stress UspA family protein
MFQNVLVGADSSVTAARAVRAAADLAKAIGATLHVVTAYKPETVRVPDLPTEFADRVTHPADVLLEELRMMVDKIGVNAEFHAATGEPAEAIIRVADRIGADLVVVGNRGMRGVRRILGSVPNTVAHSANCSVLIVDTITEPGEGE